MKKISILVGSLRKGSFARKIAKTAIEMFPKDYEAKIVEIGNLPLYNADYDIPAETDKPLPETYIEFRQTIKASSGVLFVTPEHNRVVPACIKNAIDVGSKPNGDVAWKNLPAGIISHSIGSMGGYSSQKTLRLALSYFDMKLTGQPEAFIRHSNQLFDEGSSKINNQSTLEFLQKYIDSFIRIVEKS